VRWLPRRRLLPQPLQRLSERIFFAHFTADLRSLAAGRIALASVLLLDLALRARELSLWYTNDGIVPNHTLLWRPAWDHVFSLFYLASYTHEAVAGFAMCAVAYACLLLGFRTRVAQVGSLVCLISLHGRMLLFDNGGDVALGLLCIWTTFLPTGARFSVDAVLARARAHDIEPETFVAPVARPRAVSFAVLAVTWQLALIYFFNAVHKQGNTWREGSAVHYVLHLDRLATPLAVWLRDWIPPQLSRAFTWTALGIEWSLPLLLLSPFAVRGCRRLAIILIVTLHSGFGLFMRLGIFVPAMIAYTPHFLHGSDWDALGRWWAHGRRRAAFGARVGAWLRASILALARTLTPGRALLLAPPGPAARALLRRLPLARELTVVAVIVIATNQLLDENGAAHTVIDHHNAPTVAAAVSYMNLFQGWSMFAPDAPTSDLNVVVDATTADGRHVDPLSEVATPDHPRPGLSIPPGHGPSALFYGYENHLPRRPAYYQALTEWILRYPARTGHPEDRIVAFQVFSVEDDSPPLGQRTPTNLRWTSLLTYP
jgi:hypothetical protein